jgi:hypothetical protein
MPSGFYNGSIMFADNVRFDGLEQPGQVTADGQLIIGSGVAPHLRVATLTAGTGITITNGAGSITISAAGGSGIETINGDSGSITGSSVTIFANKANRNAGASVEFVNSGTTSTLNVTSLVLFNTFIGQNAGTLTASGGSNTSLGYGALASTTSGERNTAIGTTSMLAMQSGQTNSAFGNQSLLSCVNGSGNNCFGNLSMALGTGSGNCAFGNSSLYHYLGDNASAFGNLSCRDVTGAGNAGFGYITLVNCTTGLSNTAIGNGSLQNVVTGSNNTCLGYNSGFNYTTSDSNNICIGPSVLGVTGESNTLRIGNGQTSAFVQGIAGVNVSNAQAVTINSSTGQLGSIAGSVIQEAQITLTSQQIKNLNATPIEIIPAQGAGTVINVTEIVIKFIYGGSNVFVAGAGQTIQIYYSTLQFRGILLSNSNLIGSQTIYTLMDGPGNLPAIPANLENQPIVAYQPNATEISGNASNDNTIKILVKYFVVNI